MRTTDPSRCTTDGDSSTPATSACHANRREAARTRARPCEGAAGHSASTAISC
jgi:hypothetical protein